jgi:hypothetical protein
VKKNDVSLRVILTGIHDVRHQPAPARIDDHRRLSKQRRPRQEKSNPAQQNCRYGPQPSPLLGRFFRRFLLWTSRVPRQIYLRDKLEFR